MLKNFAWIIFSLLLIFSCNNQPESAEQVADSATSAKEKSENTSNTTEEKKIILFFGNSLTAGYGLEEEQSFPYLIQERLDSLNLNYQAVNAGLSGETTSNGLNRIEWILRQKIDVFVLELGANDMLRGVEVSSTRENLKGILQKVKSKNPNVKFVIAGMIAPPNMGEEYTKEFAKTYADLAEEFDAGLIPFLLEDVGGIADLNLPDGKHPNAEGQKIVRENVWKVLKNHL